MNLGKQINTAAEEMAPAYRLTAGISSSPPTDTLVTESRTSIFPNGWMIPGKTGQCPKSRAEINSIGFDAYRFTFNDSSSMPISPLPAMLL